MVFGFLRRGKGDPVTVPATSIAHAGWGYKLSKHFEVWRKRWMILLKNGTLLSFEDEVWTPGPTGRANEEEQVELGIPTERFLVRALQESVALGRRAQNGAEDPDEGVLHLYVDYPSTRNRLKRKMPLLRGEGGDGLEAPSSTRRRFVCIDADSVVEKLHWKDALREVLRKLPQISVEDVIVNRLESREQLTGCDPTERSSEKVRNHEDGSVSDADTTTDDLKGWSAGLYHQRR